MKPMKALLGIVLGVFITPFLLLFTKKSATKLRFLDSVYGNVDDGLDGDQKWYPEWVKSQFFIVKQFPRYWWLSIRNPAHNLLKSMGANGTVSMIQKVGQIGKTGGYRATAMVGGKLVTFDYGVYKYPMINRYLRYSIGVKLWPQINVGDKINNNYALAFQPFTTARNAGIN